MKIYEYDFDETSFSSLTRRSVMHARGIHGWELISVIMQQKERDIFSGKTIFYWKREIIPNKS